MEVTNVQDKITHAVIGRGQVESFGMSEDAELYHILSSALYSRKKEAAVREVLCNAWDSHVDSEITHLPVEVTLNGEKLVIRDFGAGLAPSQIKPVYGTYGRSTKKHDGKQTGGFGLGSKAPFAYVDHFEVISYHDGVKTIYKMSQSNAEVGGKPSITTIVSVPTDDSGLQVTIQLKDPEDRHEFETLVRRIVEMGDMNVTLNDTKEPLRTIPFNESEHGFMLVKAGRFNNNAWNHDTKSIMVRYGHVVYPLQHDDRYAHLFGEVQKFLQTISSTERSRRYGHDREDWVLVLQAEPHSISVTPSREDLSMTDKTVATVTQMLERFMNFSRGRLEATCTEMFADAVSMTWLLGTPQNLFTKEKQVPLVNKAKVLEDNFVYDFDQLSRYYLTSTYPQFPGFRKTDLSLKLDSLISSGFGNRGMLQSFKNEIIGKRTDPEAVTSWFHRRLVRLALRGSTITKAVDPARLYVYTTVTKGKYGRSTEPGFIEAHKWVAPTPEKCLPFLRNMVILTYSRTMFTMDRLGSFPVCRHWLGSALDSLCYAVPRNTDKVKAAREHFERLGFTVLDLTISQPWEHQDVAEPETRAAPRPRKKGIPCLAGGMESSNVAFIAGRMWQDDSPRIEKPEFILKLSSKSDGTTCLTPQLTMQQSISIVRKYGSKGGVVQNSIQHDKLIGMGAKPMKQWLAEKLLEEYKNNPLIKTHYEYSYSHRSTDQLGWDKGKIFRVCRIDPELRKKFSLNDPIAQNEKDIIEIYESFSKYERANFPTLVEIDTLVASWALNPNAKKLIDLLDKSRLVDIIEASDVEAALVSTSTTYTAKHKTAVRAILLLAMEG